jgi:hypothetical protein
MQENTALLPPVKDNIARYAIYRSPLQVQMFNVVAMSSRHKPLFVQQADVTFSEAETLTNQLNKELGIDDEICK